MKDFSKDVGIYDQTTGKSIKLQTGVGLVGVKHNMSPMPFNGNNYLKPFWVHDKYIAYCGLTNTGTPSNVSNNPLIRILDAEANTEYFAESIPNLLNTSASYSDMYIDPVCNGLGFFLGKVSGWGALYDHEKKTFTPFTSMTQHSNLYCKNGFTKNYAFQYRCNDKTNRTVQYIARGQTSGIQNFYLPSTSINGYYLGYAGVVDDNLYLADIAQTSYSGVKPIRIVKADLTTKTASVLLEATTGLNFPHVSMIMADADTAYFIISSSAGTYSKVLAFKCKTESWNLDSVLASNEITGSLAISNPIYLGTIGDRVYFYENTNAYYFDKSDLQIYNITIKDFSLSSGSGNLQYHTNEVKFDRYIIFRNGYIDSDDMAFHYFYPVAIANPRATFQSGANAFYYNDSNGGFAYGTIIHEGIVGLTIFDYPPSSSPARDYNNQYFGRIQPILLNNLA